MSPVPDAIQRIHSSSPTPNKSSDTPSTNPPQIPKEDNVNSSSGNDALPNNEGISQFGSIIAPDVVQVAAYQGVDESRRTKRRRIEETLQETQSSKGGGVPSSS
jgi:hypothetical protein